MLEPPLYERWVAGVCHVTDREEEQQGADTGGNGRMQRACVTHTHTHTGFFLFICVAGIFLLWCYKR